MARTLLSLLISVSLCLYPIKVHGAFGEFSLADEEKLGEQFSIFVKSALPIVYDPEIMEYVQGIVTRIVAKLPANPYKFTVFVIKDPAVNAFATPGGFIFVHTGLLFAMEDEDQLAGVLSHEIAHITNRHIAKRIERSQKIALASLLSGLAGLALGPAGIAILLGSLGAGHNANLYFSRSDESEADKAGMQYLTQAGYNPYGLSESFSIIRKNMIHKGIGDIPVYMNTHPEVTERISTTKTQAKTFSKAIQERARTATTFKEIQLFAQAKYDIPERAMAVLSNNTSCMGILGKAMVYSRIRSVQKSKELFAKALACNPNAEIFYREAGIFAFETNDIAQAEVLLTQAVLMNEKDYYAMFYLARLKGELKKTAQSLSLYKRVLAELPEDAEVLYYYGKELGRTGNEFLGYVMLSYSAIYVNNIERAKRFITTAEKLAQTEEEKGIFEAVKTLFDVRAKFISNVS